MPQIKTKFIEDNAVTNAKIGTGIDATKLADGSVTNTELQYLGNVTSDLQTQLNGKQATIGTLGVSNGGTGQTSYTDGQLLIGNSTGNTLTKTTLTSGSGISITNGSGSITIASTGTAVPAYNYTSQSTTYSASVGDYIYMSGASWTVTLPTAVGQAGKQIVLHHNGTSISQVYQVNTTSGQTVAGLASGVFKLFTNAEVLVLTSDNANWVKTSHLTATGEIDFGTMTVSTGAINGSASINKITGVRNGKFLELTYRMQQASAGTQGSGTYNWSLPTNITADTTYITVSNTTSVSNGSNQAAAIIGGGYIAINSSSTGAVQCYASSSTAFYCITDVKFSTAGYMGSTLYALSNANMGFTFNIKIPVSEWQP